MTPAKKSVSHRHEGPYDAAAHARSGYMKRRLSKRRRQRLPPPPPLPPPCDGSAGLEGGPVLPCGFLTRQEAELFARIYIGAEEVELARSLVEKPRRGGGRADPAIATSRGDRVVGEGEAKEQQGERQEREDDQGDTPMLLDGPPLSLGESRRRRRKGKGAAVAQSEPNRQWLFVAGNNNEIGAVVLQCIRHKRSKCHWKLVISRHTKDTGAAAFFPAPTTPALATATGTATSALPIYALSPTLSGEAGYEIRHLQASDVQDEYWQLSNPISSHSPTCVRGPLYPELLGALRRDLARRDLTPITVQEEKALFGIFVARWEEQRQTRLQSLSDDGFATGS